MRRKEFLHILMRFVFRPLSKRYEFKTDLNSDCMLGINPWVSFTAPLDRAFFER